MAIETTKAEGYRRRAVAAGKRMPSRSGSAYLALQKKQKALNDMANIEDWLNGKPLQNQRVALARNLLAVEKSALCHVQKSDGCKLDSRRQVGS